MKHRRNQIVGACALFVAGGLGLSACKLTRAGYESASYHVVRTSGPFEIRDYPDITVVSTPMNPAGRVDNDSFRQLFRYISGENVAEQKIAMTTPVFSDQGQTNRRMSFVIPKEVALEGPPAANRTDVKLTIRPGGRFAVYRYSGGWNENQLFKAQKKLTAWLEAERLVPLSEFESANYDPPFIPAFLRRNEILVRIKNDTFRLRND